MYVISETRQLAVVECMDINWYWLIDGFRGPHR